MRLLASLIVSRLACLLARLVACLITCLLARLLTRLLASLLTRQLSKLFLSHPLTPQSTYRALASFMDMGIGMGVAIGTDMGGHAQTCRYGKGIASYSACLIAPVWIPIRSTMDSL